MRPKTAHFCSFLASKLMILHKKTRFWLKKRLMAPLILQRYMPPCAEWKNEWCRGSSVLEVLPPGCNSNGSIPLICAMPSWLSMWGNTVALIPCARIHVWSFPYCKGTKKWAEYQILAQKSIIIHTEITENTEIFQPIRLFILLSRRNGGNGRNGRNYSFWIIWFLSAWLRA